MKKINIIYWSGTGNTEKMADAIKEGASLNDVKINLLNVSQAEVEDIISADVIALGCPAMGAEELEEGEMEPFIESIESKLNGKRIALFGSYGWGDGEWMRNWKNRMENLGAELLEEGLIINEEPDEEGLKKCRDLGKKLADI
ncbi:flavodoxin [Clostridium sp. KNHs214]|uniref:flavodoxin n=1 Tax=Clostridium sp. KNHs214 TaxID=1540257 RepID=UPI0005553A10|nr:flavodoxin [Clostridium sp. KNHs214]